MPFTKKDLDKQILEVLETTKQELKGISPIASVIGRIKKAKQIETKEKPGKWL